MRRQLWGARAGSELQGCVSDRSNQPLFCDSFRPFSARHTRTSTALGFRWTFLLLHSMDAAEFPNRGILSKNRHYTHNPYP
jgi:hypothetical protein